nr:C6 zinc finger domain containing protein [Colletotrichum truncatum]KAF6794054.1 C6 zinc finger domain containing protein [Colletotrichum truncatum]
MFFREKKAACDGKLVWFQCLRHGIKCEYRTVSQTILNAIPAGSQIVDKAKAAENADAAVLLGTLKHLPKENALQALHIFDSNDDYFCLSLPGERRRKQHIDVSHFIVPPKPPELCDDKLLSLDITRWINQGYTVFEPQSTIIGYAFYKEAKKLWQRGKTAKTDNICNVSAVYYLAITAISRGAGIEYVEYLNDALEMAKRLGFFNVNSSEAPDLECYGGPDAQRVTAQTAWALFNCSTLLSMHLHKRLIVHPPCYPIPDRTFSMPLRVSLSDDDERQGDINAFFKENCGLFLIAHDMIRVTYGQRQLPYAGVVSLVFAEETYGRLLLWADSSPLETAQDSQRTHHQSPCTSITISSSSICSVLSFGKIASLHCNFGLLLVKKQHLKLFNVLGHSSEWNFYFRLCIASYQTLYCSFQ